MDTQVFITVASISPAQLMEHSDLSCVVKRWRVALDDPLFLSWGWNESPADVKIWRCLMKGEWGDQVWITLLFCLPSPAMFSPSPFSSRRSPACLQTATIRSSPFSMFCVQLPRPPLNCTMKHSPTSTKVSIGMCFLDLMLKTDWTTKYSQTYLMIEGMLWCNKI